MNQAEIDKKILSRVAHLLVLPNEARVTAEHELDSGAVQHLANFTIEELRGIYTMCQGIPTPSIGSRETSSGLRKLAKIVGAEYCRDCRNAGVHRNRRGYMVCDDHKDPA